MPPSKATYDHWYWWCASDGGRSAPGEDFYALDRDTRIALAIIMRKWLRGEVTRRQHDTLGDGLRELRYRSGNNHFRILFTTDGRSCLGLHVFYKNQQQTPKKDLDLAKKRSKSGGRSPFVGVDRPKNAL